MEWAFYRKAWGVNPPDPAGSGAIGGARAPWAWFCCWWRSRTIMARLNYFEWMFHPVESVQFDAASGSKLGDGEMILALRFGSDARAYPIREMAYHHIVNDVVGGVPVAVTY